MLFVLNHGEMYKKVGQTSDRIERRMRRDVTRCGHCEYKNAHKSDPENTMLHLPPHEQNTLCNLLLIVAERSADTAPFPIR